MESATSRKGFILSHLPSVPFVPLSVKNKFSAPLFYLYFFMTSRFSQSLRSAFVLPANSGCLCAKTCKITGSAVQDDASRIALPIFLISSNDNDLCHIIPMNESIQSSRKSSERLYPGLSRLPGQIANGRYRLFQNRGRNHPSIRSP